MKASNKNWNESISVPTSNPPYLQERLVCPGLYAWRN